MCGSREEREAAAAAAAACEHCSTAAPAASVAFCFGGFLSSLPPTCACLWPRCMQAHLHSALRHARLMPPDADLGWEDLHYSRGGRTDKGVSGERV